MRYWLVKSEPDSRIVNGVDVKFSINDLETKLVTNWDGVRNYQARNILRDQMKLGDICFFYHSNTKKPGIAGLAQVTKEGIVDDSAFDPNSPYYDPKSDPRKPKWYMVQLQFMRHLDSFITLHELKQNHKLRDMVLCKANRLSVQPVKESEYNTIMEMESKKVY
jgi:predicted RNA-binding protein with PUA-like domain